MPHLPLPAGRAGGGPPFFRWCRRAALAGLLLMSGAGFGQGAAPRAAAHAAPAARRGRTTVDFAKGFTLSYAGNYKVLTVLSPVGQQATATRYLLVPRGAARPAGFADAQVIETPIRTLVGLSSLHVALADFLGADDVLVGLGDFKYVSAPRVRAAHRGRPRCAGSRRGQRA